MITTESLFGRIQTLATQDKPWERLEVKSGKYQSNHTIHSTNARQLINHKDGKMNNEDF